MRDKELVEKLAAAAGITINGDAPADIKVRNEKFYGRVLREGSLGLGESYMDGWWDCPHLDEFFTRVLSADLVGKVGRNPRVMLRLFLRSLGGISPRLAFRVGERHYDLGNDLYRAMLDRRLTYTCAYWGDGARNLDEAQERKLDLICRKINLREGEKVLDIGSGWGSFLKFAAEKYGAVGTGVTVSKEQKALADRLTADLPVKTLLRDYRRLCGKFDKIVSIGMFEHVGRKNYREFMETAARLLKDDGLFLLHTIGGLRSRSFGDPWIDKYIFPNGMLPSLAQIAKAAEGLFVIEDVHNFGADYDKTLMSWYDNFEKNWPSLRGNYDERFYRMWKYYLLSCAGSFRARKNQLWQIVLSKKGVPGGYKSIR